MPTRFNIKTNEQDASEVLLPKQTATYTVVPNELIFDLIHKQIDNYGLKIISTDLTTTKNHKKIIGIYDFESEDDELGFRLGFKNSYDGTVSFGLGIGDVVWLCSNGLISAEIQSSRIHRGNAVEDIKEMIKTGFESFVANHNENVYFKNKLKQINPQNDINTIVGKLYMDGVMNTTELNAFKKDLNDDSLFKTINNPDFTAWDLYNHGTEALKLASINTYFQKHLDITKIFKEQYL